MDDGWFKIYKNWLGIDVGWFLATWLMVDCKGLGKDNPMGKAVPFLHVCVCYVRTSLTGIMLALLVRVKSNICRSVNSEAIISSPRAQQSSSQCILHKCCSIITWREWPHQSWIVSSLFTTIHRLENRRPNSPKLMVENGPKQGSQYWLETG